MRCLALPALLLLAACSTGFGDKYRPVVDAQGSIHHGVNYEADLAACQGLTRPHNPELARLRLAQFGLFRATPEGALSGTAVAPPNAPSPDELYLQWQHRIIRECMTGRGYVVLP